LIMTASSPGKATGILSYGQRKGWQKRVGVKNLRREETRRPAVVPAYILRLTAFGH